MSLYIACPKCNAARAEVSLAGKIKRHRMPTQWGRGLPCDASGTDAPPEALLAAIAARIEACKGALARTAAYAERELAEVEAKIARWEAMDADRVKEIASLEKLAAKRAKAVRS